MSKLDDIVMNAKAVVLYTDGSIANYATMPEQDKQQIKDLMLDVIGMDDNFGPELAELVAYKNAFRRELRRKVSEL